MKPWALLVLVVPIAEEVLCIPITDLDTDGHPTHFEVSGYECDGHFWYQGTHYKEKQKYIQDPSYSSDDSRWIWWQSTQWECYKPETPAVLAWCYHSNLFDCYDGNTHDYDYIITIKYQIIANQSEGWYHSNGTDTNDWNLYLKETTNDRYIQYDINTLQWTIYDAYISNLIYATCSYTNFFLCDWVETGWTTISPTQAILNPTASYVTIWYDDMEQNNGWILNNASLINTSYPSSGCGDNLCTRTSALSGIERSTNITNYGNIVLQFDLSNWDMDSTDLCKVFVAYDVRGNRKHIANYTGINGNAKFYLNQLLYLPSQPQSTIVWLFLEIFSNTTNKHCYWDNVYLKGIPVTMAPTLPTIETTITPTVNPTISPIIVPTTSRYWLFQIIWYDDMEVNNGWSFTNDAEIRISYESSGCSDNLCTRTGATSSIYRSTDIARYTDILLQFDVSNTDMGSELCRVYYAYDSKDNKLALVDYHGDDTKTMFHPNQLVYLPSSPESTTVWIFLESFGNGDVFCYWDNVYLKGILGTPTHVHSHTAWYSEDEIVIVFISVCVCIVIILIAWNIYIQRKRSDIYRMQREAQTVYMMNPMVIAICIGRYDDPMPTDTQVDGLLPNLDGIYHDIRNMSKLYRELLGYTMYPQYDLDDCENIKQRWTKNEMVELLKDKANILNNSLHIYDGLVCMISSHGYHDCIVSSDYKKLDKAALHRAFSVDHPLIRRIPRCFIYDCCDGDDERVGLREDINAVNLQQTNALRLAGPNINRRNILKDEKGARFMVPELELQDYLTLAADTSRPWAYDEANPDYKLVVINAANKGFQSKMSTVDGSYCIHKLTHKLMHNISNNKNEQFLFEIIHEVQNDLHEAGKQLINATYNNETDYIKFKQHKNPNTYIYNKQDAIAIDVIFDADDMKHDYEEKEYTAADVKFSALEANEADDGKQEHDADDKRASYLLQTKCESSAHDSNSKLLRWPMSQIQTMDLQFRKTFP